MANLVEPPPFQSSGELPVISPERANDIDLKHERVAQFLKENRLAALLLQRPANLAWFTSGADFTRHGSSETTASLFLLPEARVVLTSNVESARSLRVHWPVTDSSSRSGRGMSRTRSW